MNPQALAFRDLSALLGHYQVVLEPDENTAEWWAGAPSVARDADGVFHMAARMREGNSPRGLRGYEVRLLRSTDGIRFEPVHGIKREDAGVPGFERPALVYDQDASSFNLYACSPLPDKGWSILRFEDAADPASFSPEGWRCVLTPADTAALLPNVTGYKDPFVFRVGDGWRMVVIGADRVERAYHFVSADGWDWEPAPAPILLDNGAWHNFYTRPACVLPLDVGYLVVYEGSNTAWHDPIYNIATGLAYSLDLETLHDLCPEGPLLRSTTPGPYATWRYSHWLHTDEGIHVYFEAARPNNTNEIRVAVLPAACGGV